MATPNPNGRIEAGQPIAQAISARAWNRAQDAADLILNNSTQFGAAGAVLSSAPYSWVYLKNNGGDVGQGFAIAITGIAAGPYPNPVLKGAEPGSGFTSGPDSNPNEIYEVGRRWRYAITLEPIPSGSIGRVALSGVVQARINLTTDVVQGFKTKVGPVEGGFARMEPAISGGFEVIAYENDENNIPKYGDNIAVVRFNSSGAGAEMRLCKTSAWFWKENPAPPIVGSLIPLHEPDGDEIAIRVRNMFADVAPDKFVMAARAADGHWYAIAAECG